MSFYINTFAAGSFISNFLTFLYTKQTFDAKQSLYYILLLDSGLTGLSSLATLGFYLFEKHFNSLQCAMLNVAIGFVPLIFPILNFVTAYIRFKKVENSKSLAAWKSDQQLIKYVNGLVIITLIYLTILVGLNAKFENVDFSPLYMSA